MPGPLDAIRFAHVPIRQDIKGIKQELSVIASLGAGDVRALSQRFAVLEEFIGFHEGAEEHILFPAIDAKVANTSSAYEQQHREMDTLRGRLRDALAVADAERAYTLASEMDTKMNAHLDQEEQQLLALCDQHIPVPEQAALGGQMSAHTPQDKMPGIMAWMLKLQGPAEREGFLRMLMRVMPPPAFQGVKAIAQQSLRAQDWEDLTKRIPELTA